MAIGQHVHQLQKPPIASITPRRRYPSPLYFIGQRHDANAGREDTVLENASLALRDLYSLGVWDSLCAYQQDLAALEPDADSDAPSAVLLDALRHALSGFVRAVEKRRANP